MKKEILYVIKANDSIKIGITNNLKSRISLLQTGNPIKLVKHLIITSDCRKTIKSIEKILHNKFREYRLIGEWFNYHIDIDDHILNIPKEYQNVQLEYYNDIKKPGRGLLKVEPSIVCKEWGRITLIT